MTEEQITEMLAKVRFLNSGIEQRKNDADARNELEELANQLDLKLGEQNVKMSFDQDE